MPFKDLVIDRHASIHEAMQQLDRAAKRILLILEDGHLIGALTDGDIRRFILKNGDLKSSVESVFNHNPICLPVSEKHRAREVMKERRIEAVPLVDADNRVVEIAFWHEVQAEPLHDETLDLPVVIMAGGEGTRLYPYTKILPKPLIPIGDTPILERIINRFHEFGCMDFHVTVNYKKNMIRSYFGELEVPYRVHFVDEPRPLGTGGSLALLRSRLTGTFFVSNCDILIDTDYTALVRHHRDAGNQVTMITSVKHFKIPYGVVHLNAEGGIERQQEKPEMVFLVNTGLYLMEPSVFDCLPESEFFHVPDLVDNCRQMGRKVGVFPVSENAWMDMGQFDEMNKMLAQLGNKP